MVRPSRPEASETSISARTGAPSRRVARGVDELDDHGVEGGEGHLLACDGVGGEKDVVGAGAEHAGLAVGKAGAGDYEEVRPEGLGGEDDEGVAGVGVGGGEEDAGALDAGFFEDGVAGGIAWEEEVAAEAAALDGFGVGLDDDEGEVAVGELAGDLLSDATEAAEDVVVLEVLDLTFHAPYPQ